MLTAFYLILRILWSRGLLTTARGPNPAPWSHFIRTAKTFCQ